MVTAPGRAAWKGGCSQDWLPHKAAFRCSQENKTTVEIVV
jgi:hypothetical protein